VRRLLTGSEASARGALALPARSASTVVVADNGAPLGGIGGEGGAGVGVHATGGGRVDLGSEAA
jgi:hypothetical protein